LVSGSQTVERQTALLGPGAQVPSPLAYPQRPSLSQTPLAQVSAPAAVVHMPFSVVSLWAGSVGTAMPFGTVGAHMWAVSLHQVPAAQSASTVQPLAPSQTMLEPLHMPERQTVPPLAIEQGPSPFA